MPEITPKIPKNKMGSDFMYDPCGGEDVDPAVVG